MNHKDKWRMALSIGLSGGVFWGLISLSLYYLQFTDIGPSIYAKPILASEYEMKWQGHMIGLGFFILFTLIESFLYAVFFIKFKSPWVGIAYGLLLWTFIFIMVNPLFHLTQPVKDLGFNTNSVMISLYILIGLFIGYSLSVEFNNQEGNEEKE